MRTIGSLPPAVMTKVDVCRKAALRFAVDIEHSPASKRQVMALQCVFAASPSSWPPDLPAMGLAEVWPGKDWVIAHA